MRKKFLLNYAREKSFLTQCRDMLRKRICEAKRKKDSISNGVGAFMRNMQEKLHGKMTPKKSALNTKKCYFFRVPEMMMK